MYIHPDAHPKHRALLLTSNRGNIRPLLMEWVRQPPSALRTKTDLLPSAETFLIIVCGCIPTLKPIYDQLFNRRARVPSGPPSYAPYMKSYKSASSGPSKPPSNKHSLSFAESTLPYNKDVSITITQMSSVRSLSDGSNGTETIRSDTEKGLVVNVSEKIPNDYVHRKPGFDPYPLDTLDMV